MPLACLFGSLVARSAAAAPTPIPAPSAKPQPDGRVEYSYTESDILGHITVITYDPLGCRSRYCPSLDG